MVFDQFLKGPKRAPSFGDRATPNYSRYLGFSEFAAFFELHSLLHSEIGLAVVDLILCSYWLVSRTELAFSVWKNIHLSRRTSKMKISTIHHLILHQKQTINLNQLLFCLWSELVNPLFDCFCHISYIYTKLAPSMCKT